MGKVIDLYGGKDPRTVPRYAVGEAALYLRLPRATLKTWVHGRVDQNGRQAEAVIKLPASSGLLSFQNLVEAHVLGAIRRQHGVSLQRVRKALRFVQRKIQQPHPLITVEFQTDGVDLFGKELGRLINASGAGQTFSYGPGTVLTTTRTGFDGYDCAAALPARAHSTIMTTSFMSPPLGVELTS